MPLDAMQKRQRAGALGAPPSAGGVMPGAQQATPAQPAQAQPPQQQGTGFVSFDRYLDANKDAAKAMANTVTGNVAAKAEGAQQGIQQAQQRFDGATAAATLRYSQDKAPDAATATRLAGTTYEGPKTWNDAGVDTQALHGEVAKANDAVANLGSLGGRSSLLRESYRNGPMTTGGSLLDAVLLGQAGGARMAELQGQYGGLSERLKVAQGGADEAYGAAARDTATAAGQYGTLAGQYRTAETERQRGVQAERDRAAAERRRRENEARARQDGQWSPEEAMALDDIKNRNRRGEAP